MTQISESSTHSATLDDVAPRTSPVASQNPATVLFADLDTELATTRRMLERVPDGKDDWRPHKKSRTLDELATHVAQLPGFGIMMLTQDEFDGGTQPPEPKRDLRALAAVEVVAAVSRHVVTEPRIAREAPTGRERYARHAASRKARQAAPA